MIQSTGGEWTVEDLDATGRLYQLPFYPEAHRSNGCSTHPGTTLGRCTLGANGVEPAAARSVSGIPTSRDSESAGFCRFSSNVASIRDKGLMEATPFPAQMRRTSIYSIPSGIQRPGAISQGGTKSGIAHPEPAREGVSPCPSNLRSVR
jgi:hypothetical protein